MSTKYLHPIGRIRNGVVYKDVNAVQSFELIEERLIREAPTPEAAAVAEKAADVIRTLRESLHREMDYTKDLERTVSVWRDAIDAIACQTHLSGRTARRIARLARETKS